MLAETKKKLPQIIDLFPGFEDRAYFQDPETLEYWFHATNVCKVLGFSNATSALSLHCEEDEKLMEICGGKATWFVSEAGCYGLAMGAKNEVAQQFKRWLKHDVLPKLRASGTYTMPNATSRTSGKGKGFGNLPDSKTELTKHEAIALAASTFYTLLEFNKERATEPMVACRQLPSLFQIPKEVIEPAFERAGYVWVEEGLVSMGVCLRVWAEAARAYQHVVGYSSYVHWLKSAWMHKVVYDTASYQEDELKLLGNKYLPGMAAHNGDGVIAYNQFERCRSYLERSIETRAMLPPSISHPNGLGKASKENRDQIAGF